MSRKQGLWLKIAGVLAFLAGMVALYFGFLMTFLVPGTPGEGFFVKERVILGILPLLAALVALCLSGWLFFRSIPNPRRHLSDVFLFRIAGGIYQSANGF